VTAEGAAPAQPAGPTEGTTAARGALFIAFAKVYFMISGFLQQVLLPGLVSSTDYGAFAVVNPIISIVNNTVVQATVQTISKFTSEDERRAGAVQRAGVRMQLELGLALAIALFVGAPLIAAFEKAPPYTLYIRIAAAIPFLYAVYAVFVGTANGLRRFRTQASFDVGFSTAKTMLLLGGAILWKVAGAFGGFAAAAAVILIVASRVMRMPATTADGFTPRRLGRYMGVVMVSSFLLNVALNYDPPLLRRFAALVDPTRAGSIVGHYQTLRNLALLPYQFLIVVTFVIFPLVSRATFVQDRAATRLYVTQTLRYALILAAGMGLLLAARPAALLGILYKPEYSEGAAALPILVTGECCLALLGVGCAILNAAGRTKVTVVIMGVTVAVGAVAMRVLVLRAQPGPEMLVAAATATSLGMAAGLLLSLWRVRASLGGSPPGVTVARVAAAGGAAVLVGRFLPGHGRLLGLVAIAIVGAVYLAVLIATGELGPDDRAKVARMLRRGKR
jgi:stage V sporulation protein B